LILWVRCSAQISVDAQNAWTIDHLDQMFSSDQSWCFGSDVLLRSALMLKRIGSDVLLRSELMLTRIGSDIMLKNLGSDVIFKNLCSEIILTCFGSDVISKVFGPISSLKGLGQMSCSKRLGQMSSSVDECAFFWRRAASRLQKLWCFQMRTNRIVAIMHSE